jgi:hypothetical protein
VGSVIEGWAWRPALMLRTERQQRQLCMLQLGRDPSRKNMFLHMAQSQV